MKKIFNHTWVFWINTIILQWFFIRLGYDGENEKDFYILYFIFPLTGWINNFWYVSNKQYIKKIR
jgi:hypothetical protein